MEQGYKKGTAPKPRKINRRMEEWLAQGFNPHNCPVRQVLDHISAKWPVLVLFELSTGPKRFNELWRNLPDISKRMLTQSLRNLERDGIIRREVFDTKPPSVSYSLTELGKDFLPPLFNVVDWAGANMPRILEARTAFDEA